MLHVGWDPCHSRVSERNTVTCKGSLTPRDMNMQQAGCLKLVLGWAWRSTHARLREAHAMHSGGCLLGRCLPAGYHDHRMRFHTQGAKSRVGSVRAASGAQASQGSTVLLVESPAKAKKLQQFLGPDYKVRQSMPNTVMVQLSLAHPSPVASSW